MVVGEAPSCPYTVHRERLNGMWRDRLACLTRKTHAVVKAVGTWDEAVTVALVEHNWLRPHAALRQRLPEAVGPGTALLAADLRPGRLG